MPRCKTSNGDFVLLLRRNIFEKLGVDLRIAQGVYSYQACLQPCIGLLCNVSVYNVMYVGLTSHIDRFRHSHIDRFSLLTM